MFNLLEIHMGKIRDFYRGDYEIHNFFWDKVISFAVACCHLSNHGTDCQNLPGKNSQMILLKFHHTDCFSVWRYGSLQRLSSYLGCQCDNWFQITFQKPNIQWKYKAVKVKISQIYCSPKNFSLCVFKWWLLIFWLCFKMISSAFSQFIQFNKNDKFWQLLVKPCCCHDSLSARLSEFYFNDTNYIYLRIVVP